MSAHAASFWASEQSANRNRITLNNGAELKQLIKEYLPKDVIPGTSPAKRLRAPEGPAGDLLAGTRPLIGIDYEMSDAGDTASGLGLPPGILAPTGPLIAALGLRPRQLMTLDDDAGPGLALVIWRTCYEQSEYYLAWPSISGCAVILRPDLLRRLAEHTQAPLSLRDFVVGDDDLIPEPDE